MPFSANEVLTCVVCHEFQFSKLLITLTFSEKNIQSPVCFDPGQLADLSIFYGAVPVQSSLLEASSELERERVKNNKHFIIQTF